MAGVKLDDAYCYAIVLKLRLGSVYLVWSVTGVVVWLCKTLKCVCGLKSMLHRRDNWWSGAMKC